MTAIKREVDIGDCRLLLGDCREILPTLAKVEAVVTDPPYGIGIAKNGMSRGGGMIYGSVCSGIESASVAWEPLGWRASFLSEIEKFPRAVLTHRFPNVPLHGDFTTIQDGEYEPIDLLVGGTPCQSFSIAGLRGGLGDDRGNLALEYLKLAQRLRPRWLVWENVPGVRSAISHTAPDPVPPPAPMDLGCDGAEMETEDDYTSEELHAFYCFLAGLSELGYGWAYRSLDAQYAGLAQRRERVFVVGYLGDWRRAAAVLFERESLRGDSPPRREKGEEVAQTLASRARSGGGVGPETECPVSAQAFGGNNTSGPIEVATAVNAHGGPCGRMDFEIKTFIAHALRGETYRAGEDGTGRGTPLVPAIAPCLTRNYGKQPDNSNTNAGPMLVPVAFDCKAGGNTSFNVGNIPGTLRGEGHGGGHAAVSIHGAVRRLTPRECERLQGFPDDWTDVPYRGKPAADGPRYKAIGNSMAVPCMAWLGQRIQMVEKLT